MASPKLNNLEQIPLELVHCIFKVLDVEDIRSLRLTCQLFRLIGDEYLISHCFIDFRTPVLDTLELISSNRIAVGVSNIVIEAFDLAEVIPYDEYYEAAQEMPENLPPNPTEFNTCCRAGYDKYVEIRDDHIRNKDGKYEKLVLEAIRRFSRIDCIVFGGHSENHPDNIYWSTAPVECFFMRRGRDLTRLACKTIMRAIQLYGRAVYLTVSRDLCFQQPWLSEICSSFSGNQLVVRLDIQLKSGEILDFAAIRDCTFNALKDLRISGALPQVDSFLLFLTGHQSTLKHLTIDATPPIRHISMRDYLKGLREAIGRSLESISIASIPDKWVGLCPSKEIAHRYILTGGLNPCAQNEPGDD